MNTSPIKESTSKTVQSSETGLVMLKALASLGGSASITALASELDENPAKVHRYLKSLVATDFVYQDAETSRYILGRESIVLGLVAQRQADPVRLASAELARLSEELNASCILSIRSEQGPLVVRLEEPAQPIVVNARIGFLMPWLWSATGRTFAAFDRTPKMEEILKAELARAGTEQRRTLRTMADVHRLLDQVRDDGLGTVNGTVVPNISAIAAPLLDADHRVTAVIGALGVSGNFDASPRGRNAKALLRVARAISARLGFDAV